MRLPRRKARKAAGILIVSEGLEVAPMSESVTLVIQREGYPDRRVPLSPGSVQIGRAEDNDIVLSDIGVSRRHARILVENGSVVFEDLGSGNGSWIDGKRVRTHDVDDGDAIHVEPFMLRFQVKRTATVAQVEAEPVEEPPPPAPVRATPKPTPKPTPKAIPKPKPKPVVAQPRPVPPAPPPQAAPAPLEPAPVPEPPSSDSTVAMPIGEAPIMDTPQAAVLEAVNGTGIAGKRFDIPPQGLTIGRHEQRDIVLQDVAASRFHAEVAPRGDVYWVRDCNSANGVLVNGQKVREKPLRDGDVVKIGSTEFRFTADLQPAYMTDVIDEDAPDLTDAFEHVLDDDPPAWGSQAPNTTQPASFAPPQPASPAFSAPPASPAPAFSQPPAAQPPAFSQPPAPQPAAHPPAYSQPPSQPGFTQPAASGFGAPAASGFGAPPAPELQPAQAGQVFTPNAAAPAPVAPGGISSFPPADQPGAAPPGQPGFGAPPMAAPLGPPPDLGAIPDGGGFGGLEMQLDGGGKGRGKKLKVKNSGGFMSKPINRLTVGLLLFSVLSVGGKSVYESMSAPKAASSISSSSKVDEAPQLDHLDPLAAAEVSRLMDDGMSLVKAGKYYDATAKFRRVLQLDQTNQAAQEAGYLTCELIVVDALKGYVTARSADAGEKAEIREAAVTAATEALATSRGVSPALEMVEKALVLMPGDEELLTFVDDLKSKKSAIIVGGKRKKLAELEATVKKLYDRAQAELARGNNMGAYKYFEQAMAEDPERQTSLYFPAQDGLSQAKRAMDQESRQHYQSAMGAMRAGDYMTARTAFKKTLKANPYNTAAKTKLAEVQAALEQQGVQEFQAGKRMEAANQFERAITHYTKTMQLIEDRSNQTFQNAQQRVSMLSSVVK